MTQEHYFITDIALKALVEKDGKVLLVLNHNGTWEFPGGRMNENETPIDGLKRELKEELNLDIELGQLFDAFNFTSESGKNHFVVIYKCEVKNLENIKIVDGEVKDLKWVGPGEYENLPMRQYKEALRKYFKK